MFQPTHPHGVRREPANQENLQTRFQPTHPHGVRLRSGSIADATRHVSTHAPARGATGILLIFHVVRIVSTHAPARGATV